MCLCAAIAVLLKFWLAVPPGVDPIAWNLQFAPTPPPGPPPRVNERGEVWQPPWQPPLPPGSPGTVEIGIIGRRFSRRSKGSH